MALMGVVQGDRGAEVGQEVAGSASSNGTAPSACTSPESTGPTGEDPALLVLVDKSSTTHQGASTSHGAACGLSLLRGAGKIAQGAPLYQEASSQALQVLSVLFST